MKREWKQEYFSLVEAYRDKQGKPRQHSLYLGKTLNLSVQEWVAVLGKVEDGILTRGDVQVYGAVRAYCKRNGLPLNTADAVRAAARAVRKSAEETEAEEIRRLLESMGKAVQDPKPRRESLFQSAFRSDKVSKAARLLGVPLPANRDEVQTAFREMARANHPDSGGDAAKFRETVEARDTLFNDLGTTQSESVVTR
jgi:hypothetical protein